MSDILADTHAIIWFLFDPMITRVVGFEVEFIAFEGKAIRLLEKFRPEPAHLAIHRVTTFKG